MKVIEQKAPFFVFDVSIHNEIKPSVVAAIESMGLYSLINEKQHIAHTDWHLGADTHRPYYGLVLPAIQDVVSKINNLLGYTDPLTIKNYWFQKYSKDGYHNWHIHKNSVFNAVYYLSLPEGASKTSFKLFEEEFSVDVKEGQILIFPSMYLHCSKLNMSDDSKLIISFNL